MIAAIARALVWLVRFVDRAYGLPACRDCGCTEHAACDGGCCWIEPDLCSSCADPRTRAVPRPARRGPPRMTAGRAIRQAQRLEAADARACDDCGHPMGEHFEIGYGVEGHVAGTFHCKREGCDCAVDLLEADAGAAPDLHVGQHVRALSSWEGYVAEISDVEACGQGRLVTCHPITLPAAPRGGRPWKPITVTEAELTPTGKPDRG